MSDDTRGAWLDLFAGAGGWDLGAISLGIHPLGIEWDHEACATRIAAGLATVEGDVAKLDPDDYAEVGGRRVVGLIGSPPCQSYSAAGKRGGDRDLDRVLSLLAEIARGEDTRAATAAEFAPSDDALFGFAIEDTRSLLVVEPLRWALALMPRWIVLEQVPGVLPVWEEMAEHLRAAGYSAWTGRLRSDEYGVPQTRERAILMADLAAEVRPPAATHQRWRKGVDKVPAAEHPAGLAPWVSMAEALGWGPDDMVGFPRRNDRPSNKPALDDDGEYRELDLRPADDPAFGLTEKARSWTRALNTGRDWKEGEDRASAQTIEADRPAPAFTVKSGGQWLWALRNGNQAKAAERTPDEPSGTLFFGERLNVVEWTPTGIVATNPRHHAAERSMDEPAPTVASGKLAAPHWTSERPATTVTGDPRVHPPGHKQNSADPVGKYEGRAGLNAVRVTVDEAAVLQGFPVGYPWQGSLTAQFRQIGNAIPPPFAAAILQALTEGA